jgi:hypothetical protein
MHFVRDPETDLLIQSDKGLAVKVTETPSEGFSVA